MVSDISNLSSSFYNHFLLNIILLILPARNFSHAIIILFCFSKEISGFAALKRTIRQVEKNDGDGHQASKSLKRVHSKKKDVMVSPQKPPNAWHAFLNENLKEVSFMLHNALNAVSVRRVLQKCPSLDKYIHIFCNFMQIFSSTFTFYFLIIEFPFQIS